MAQQFDRFLIVDFEATCDRQGTQPIYPREIIEFAAVLVDAATGEILFAFHTYVRPRYHPVLTPYCIELTGIQQEQVNASVSLGQALTNFEAWLVGHVGAGNFAVVAWGDWHCGTMLESECQFKGLAKPACFNQWVNLRVHFTEPGGQWLGLEQAIMAADLQWEGHLHNAHDDVHNVGRLLANLIQQGVAIAVTGLLQAPGPQQLEQPPNCLCGVASRSEVVMQGQRRFYMCGNWTPANGVQCRFHLLME